MIFFMSKNLLSVILFADDTNNFLRHNDVATLATILNVELSHVSYWFNANNCWRAIEFISLNFIV